MEVFSQLVAVDLRSTKDNKNGTTSGWKEEWRAKETNSVVGLLASELRAAKEGTLSCAEVLLPAKLLPKIADAVIEYADSEPYGLRGCTLFINLETDENTKQKRHVAQFKYDPETVSTFELYLTIKQDHLSWHNLLPQFIRNLTGGRTLVLADGFALTKTKLYRTYQD